ncbi:MAG: NADH-quinone oxidoreductase subunit L, partial [Bacteroidota bacterium]|nr:NADH-quinone oxidoreductase subunit L [Bacteroidota bacterium]
GTPEQENHLHESPASITIPLIILALLSVVGGFIGIPEVFAKNAHWLEHFLAPVFSQSTQLKELHHPGNSTEIAMMAGVNVLVIGTIILAWKRFSTYQKTDVEEVGLGKVLQNKWYVDELYNNIIVYPLNRLGRFFNNVFERSGIDGIVNGVGRLVQYGGRQMRWLQSGQVGSYVLLMVISMLLFFVLQFFLRK